MSFTPGFSVGTTVTNQQICASFLCGNMGGMRRSKRTNTLVIFSDHTKSLYDDKWYGDELHYTGMGKLGDQELASQNRTLAESASNGIEVHLFEALRAKEYIYHGVVRLSGTPYQEVQNDDDGHPRKVWMFPLTPLEPLAVTADAYQEYVRIQTKRAKTMSDAALDQRMQEHAAKLAAKRDIVSTVYVRDPYIAEYTKRRAHGVCQLCGQPAPFYNIDGTPYLESHHIEWLSKGGKDSTDNTAALCPNCHKKMHVVGDAKDISTLKRAISEP